MLILSSSSDLLLWFWTVLCSGILYHSFQNSEWKSIKTIQHNSVPNVLQTFRMTGSCLRPAPQLSMTFRMFSFFLSKSPHWTLPTPAACYIESGGFLATLGGPLPYIPENIDALRHRRETQSTDRTADNPNTYGERAGGERICLHFVML